MLVTEKETDKVFALITDVAYNIHLRELFR